MHTGQEIFSVSALTEAIKKRLEGSFPSVHVQGEISNLKEQASGHVYFTLKDAQSQIAAVLFRGHAKDLKRPLKNGDQVVIQGELTVYPPRGAYQLIVRSLKLVGVGELLLQLHALKIKLGERGWFSQERKKKLPRFPRTIGVITSSTGSVIQDILHILERRMQDFHLILFPVKVQGEGAAEEIATAIEECNRHRTADVLIVGRGGGSLEDLWAFNEERVASAIYHSQIPIVSAVGHETDFSLADFVADIRAPTPSAAAEIVSSETAQQRLFLQQSKERLSHLLRLQVEQGKKRLATLRRDPLFLHPLTLLEPFFQRIDDLSSQLDTAITTQIKEKQLHLLALKKETIALKPEHQIGYFKERLRFLEDGINRASSQRILTLRTQLEKQNARQRLQALLQQKTFQMKKQLELLSVHLATIHPKALLKRGYCILFHENRSSVILSTQDLKEEDRLRVQLEDGQVLVTVNEIRS